MGQPRIPGLVTDPNDENFKSEVVDEDGVRWLALIEEKDPGAAVAWVDGRPVFDVKSVDWVRLS